LTVIISEFLVNKKSCLVCIDGDADGEDEGKQKRSMPKNLCQLRNRAKQGKTTGKQRTIQSLSLMVILVVSHEQELTKSKIIRKCRESPTLLQHEQISTPHGGGAVVREWTDQSYFHSNTEKKQDSQKVILLSFSFVQLG
jgi:hypothetical protein